MANATNFVSTSTLLSGPPPMTLVDGVLVVRYALLASGGVAFECCGQPVFGNQINLPPETWREWIDFGIDLVVEPSGPSSTVGLILSDTSGGALLTTTGTPTPVTSISSMSVHLLFDSSSEGMTFKIALENAGEVLVDLGDLTASLRPPPPKLPPDPPSAG